MEEFQAIDMQAAYVAICDALRTRLPELTLVGAYEEHSNAITTPAGFLELTAITPEGPASNGQLEVTLRWKLNIIMPLTDPQRHTQLRNIALAASFVVEGNRFGIPAQPAEFADARPATFTTDTEAFESWAVIFTQKAVIGEDVYRSEGQTPSIIFASSTPYIGIANEHHYQELKEEPFLVGEQP